MASNRFVRNVRHVCSVAFGFLLVAESLLSLTPSCYAGSDLDGALRRFGELKNVVVDYDQEVEYTPLKKASELLAKSGTTPRQGKFKSTCRFLFLNGESRFETAVADETLDQELRSGAEGASFDVLVNSFERTERFSAFRRLAAYGFIANSKDMPWPDFSVVDIALGLRGFHEHRWMDGDVVKQIHAAPGADPGVVCLTVATGKGKFHSWDCSMASGEFAISKYRLTDEAGVTFIQIDCSDFEKYPGGRQFPMTIVGKKIYHGPEGTATVETDSIHIKRYSFEDSTNNKDRFVMVWPVNTTVFDRRCQESFVISSKPRTLDDDFISSASADKLKKTQARLNQILSEPPPATNP